MTNHTIVIKLGRAKTGAADSKVQLSLPRISSRLKTRWLWAYGQKIQSTRKGFRACWSRDGIHQIPGRIRLHQTACRRGSRGCRLVDLQKARLESASTRPLPQEFSRKSSWKSGRESGSAAVVVPQHAAQSLTARDLAGCATQFVARFDDAVVKPLMVSFGWSRPRWW